MYQRIRQWVKKYEQLPVERLTPSDCTILLAQHGGFPAPMQLLFFLDTPVDEEYLHVFNEHCAASGLARIVCPSVLPCAPHYWGRVEHIPPVVVHPGTLSETERQQWCDQQIHDLPRSGQQPGWLIYAGNLEEGKSFISLAISHHVADAHGAVLEIFAIADRMAHNVAPQRTFPQHLYRQLSWKHKILSDIQYFPFFWWKLLPLVLTVYVPGKLSPIISMFLSVAQRMGITWKRAAHISPHLGKTPHTHTRFFDAQQCADIAHHHGGNTTSLIAAMITNIARTVCPESLANDGLRIIMNQRTDLQSTSNNISSARIDLRGIAQPVEQLDEIKQLSKQAYAQAKKSNLSTLATPSLLVSNVGVVPGQAHQIIPHAQFAYGRAVPHATTLGTALLFQSFFGLAVIYHNVLTLSVINVQLTEYRDMKETIDAELQRWGLEERELSSLI